MASPLASPKGSSPKGKPLALLNQEIIGCEKCPRLRDWCQEVAATKRKAYSDQDYWARPVPSFGSDKAELLIVGLAPGAHGANRTGRIFTGDKSGEWLYRALFNNGLAKYAHSIDVNDGQKLANTRITCVAHCAPPDNKPTKEELGICSNYLEREIELLRPKIIICLGAIAWEYTLKVLRALDLEIPTPKPKFSHAAKLTLPDLVVLGSYHPSQQNTFTGKLTEEMLDQIFADAKTYLTSN